MKRVEGRAMVIYKLLLKVVVLGALLGSYHSRITEAADLMTKPGCRSACGTLSIPYPFGTTDSSSTCRIDSPSFTIHCDYSTNPPIPYLYKRSSDIKIFNISMEDHEMRVNFSLSQECYDFSGPNGTSSKYSGVTLGDFPISNTKNKFIVIGCDTWAYFVHHDRKYSFGCMSLCSNLSDVSSGSCSGIGCCEASIPRGSLGYQISMGSYNKHKYVLDFNPCSYAFVAENGSYNFSVSDLKQLEFNQSTLVLDWAIGSQTCEDAQKNSTSYKCANNTICTDAKNGSGYKCTCKGGYRGNPYLVNGCQDIDECADPMLNQCARNCHNIEGGYTCSCPKGHHGDGKKGGGDGQGCIANPYSSHLMEILVGVAGAVIALLFTIGFLYLGHKKMKLIRLKEQYFRQNGGLLLQQQLDEPNRNTKAMKIFSAEELEKATDNYNESRIVGQGGYGTVYKGSLPNGMVVAIKKSKLLDRNQIEQFINEVIVLSQINHRNVVKLLGCCLETEVPSLVYEFINNGTLFDHIHNPNKSLMLPWETRLRIASETAKVLSYLHSAASIPIIHRDVKSANILLDANYTTKVSDFGASRLVPLDQTHLFTMVQGTWGYLDPEYLQTNQLTEKSDVYSFGVVLVELLTGKKALSFERPEEERNLAMYFLSSVENGKLFQIVEDVIANKGVNEQVRGVTNLAKRCLTIKGEERPTMKEVAIELEGLEAMANPIGDGNTDVNQEEMVYLPGEKDDVHKDISGTMNSGYPDTMEESRMLIVSSGR